MFLLQDKNFLTSIKYFFTHSALQNLENELIQRLSKYLGKDIETICVNAGTPILGDNNCLVLIDEADDIIID